MNPLLVSIAGDRIQIDLPERCLTLLIDLDTADTLLIDLAACIAAAAWNVQLDLVDLTGPVS